MLSAIVSTPTVLHVFIPQRNDKEFTIPQITQEW